MISFEKIFKENNYYKFFFKFGNSFYFYKNSNIFR